MNVGNYDEVTIIALLSGGIDSAAALYHALKTLPRQQLRKVYAVSFNYGQRHARELTCARRIVERISAEILPAEHHNIKIPTIQGSRLTDHDAAIPDVSYDKLPHGVSPTYVPFRNGLMLSAAASWAQGFDKNLRDPNSKHVGVITAGMHAEDAQNWAYPDCTYEFANAMASAIWIGSYNKMILWTPFVHASKADVISSGAVAGAPFELTWSCYKGGELHCGVCPTCRARKDAFIRAGIDDPTDYEQ